MTKEKDENYQTFTVSDVRDCDNGYSVFFEDSPIVPNVRMSQRITYWLAKSYGFIPRPSDLFRFYGKLEAANKGMHGLDIIRTEKDPGEEKGKRVRTEIFYTEPAPAEKAPVIE